MKSSENQLTEESESKSKVEEDYYISVQEYTGQGYKLPNGEKTDKIAKEYRKEIDKAVKKFFREKYKTEVIVHNTVGAVDGATVFVESVGEPHFHTFVVIPIDVDEEEVLTDQVWSQEGEVENAIMAGIYGMIYEEEFNKLDQYLDSIVKEHPVTGIRQEALEKVAGGKFSTPYYYVNAIEYEFDALLKEYLKNPHMEKATWKEKFKGATFNPEGLLITLDLYMSKPNTEPDKVIFDKIVSDIKNMEGLPSGAYSIILNDNLISKRSARGTKDNSLRSADPDYIIK
ncbi:DUF1672 family protein [Metabacillus fastidiosus]|uniref:DUF1672 family protein n=1 Tax=Metabacillus fastidiosus TaxID=1458 RepID=A0ABU6NV73_9BACI|nr:DUF1672 family protein [Metabacillus fastidiosus]